MANILKQPSRRASIGYNGFDMSHLVKFTSTTGELLPVHYDILNPGDKVTCNIELKTRTAEIASAAMVYLEEHVDWFFVPMNQILSYFSDWYYGIQDFKTSFLVPGNNLPANIPYWSYSSFAAMLNNSFSDMFGQANSRFRLMEMFGLPVGNYVSDYVLLPTDWPIAVSAILPCAYQKIWMDHYRNTEYDINNPLLYNLDRYSGINAGVLQASENFMFTMRYRRADRDFFNNTYPSPVMGSASANSFPQSSTTNLYNQFQQWLVSGLSYYGADPNVAADGSSQAASSKSTADNLTPNGIVADPGYFSTGSTPYYQYGTNRSLQALTNPTSIRTSFAVQKLLEVTRRSGKHYDKQTLAHFGVNVPQGINGECYYLGSQNGVVNIGDVIATATGAAGSATSVLGQVGGKGYGYTKGEVCKFEAPCHGVLMALYSANVRRDYSADMFDRLNSYFERPTWFTEEYDNLGMQPLFFYQKYLDNVAATNNTVEAWQYRWSELKIKYNAVYGSFKAGRSRSFWTPQYAYNHLTGVSQHRLMYVSPNELDDIMLVPFGNGDNEPYTPASSDGGEQIGYNENWYDKDPLLHELYIDCKKASKMSTYGLEQL